MKLAIMQPFFCPFIGYFQLINAVDQFVIYDNIEYSKKSWVNRNRILMNNRDRLFTIPLNNGSDFLDIRERSLSADSIKERMKILARISYSYKKAPFYKEQIAFIEELFLFQRENLFEFIEHSVKEICSLLDIKTTFITSSSLEIDHGLKGEEKVVEICRHLGASVYINAIGGKKLYKTEQFSKRGIELKFIRTREIVYPQFDNLFVPNLSIIDMLMFNGVESTKAFLKEFEFE